MLVYIDIEGLYLVIVNQYVRPLRYTPSAPYIGVSFLRIEEGAKACPTYGKH